MASSATVHLGDDDLYALSGALQLADPVGTIHISHVGLTEELAVDRATEWNTANGGPIVTEARSDNVVVETDPVVAALEEE